METPARLVDRSYLLHEQLGEGGMGTVYRALQLTDGNTVALKLVPQELLATTAEAHGSSVSARMALAREFQTLASLHHPNIIRVLNYGFDEELGPYFSMDLLEGARPLFDADIDASEKARVQLIAQLLRALSYVHQRGVIHRDIKPGNVLVVQGELKLLDFGIAVERSEIAEFAGTVDYMAPEILRGQPPSTASDLYAVGVLFYQLLAGSFPTNGASMDSMLDMLLDEGALTSKEPLPIPVGEPLPGQNSLDALPASAPELAPLVIDIEGPLGGIVAKLLAQDPAQRYSDANEVLRDLAAKVPYELPIETAATRESFLRANMLVGRDAELATFTQALKGIRSDGGSAFLVSGESGVGKSRLIAEVRTLALVHGCWVAEGQSVAEGGYYYQEWLPLLRALCFRTVLTDTEASVLKDLIPDIGKLLGRQVEDPPKVKPEAVQVRIVSTVLELLRRQTKPLALILEDLHWARSESLALLAQVAKHASQLPILLVGTFRSDESPHLPASLPDMRCIPLLRLDEHNIARLSESMLGTVGRNPELVSYLSRQTEGNVFFLVEVVRALAENAGELQRIGQGELPEQVLTVGIERIVERRVDRVPDSYRPVLEFAATLGRKLDLPVLDQAFPEIPLRTLLIECANAAVLDSQGSDWRFAHDKLRETILRRIEPDRRKQLHAMVAEALEAVYAGARRDAMNATLAYHFQQAGLLDKALAYYLRAGESAAKLYAYEQARAHYGAAEELIHQLPDSIEHRRLHADVIIRLVEYSLRNARVDLNLQRATKVRELLESLHHAGAAEPRDRLRMARIDYCNAILLNYAGKPAQAGIYFKQVLPVAQEFGERELLLLPSLFLGVGMILQGQPGKGVALLLPLLDQFKEHFGRDIETMRGFMSAACALASVGKYRQGEPLYREAYGWVQELNRTPCTALFHTYDALRRHLAGDWPGAIAASQHIFELPADGIDAFSLYLAHDVSASSHSHLGQHDHAFKHRQQALNKRSTLGGGYMEEWWNACEAEIYLKAGQSAAALDRAAKMAARLPPDETFSRQIVERVWAGALGRLEENTAEMEAHFELSLRLSDSSENVEQGLQTELYWGQLCRERGDRAGAELHFSRARQRMREEMSPFAWEESLRIINGTARS